MNEKNKFSIEQYLEIIRYRKWLLIVPTVVMFLVTAVGTKFMSNYYRSQTLILVEAQKIPEDYVKSTVTQTIEQRIMTIREQILSRTRLEKIIQESYLYPELVAAAPMEWVLKEMRSNIDIRVQGKDSFMIFFTGRDPYTVMNVTNKLASLFIEESLKDRENQATVTLEFLDTELVTVRKRLEEQEKAMRDFKQAHIGELPEQQESNLRALDRFQLQLQTNSEAIRAAEDRKLLLESTLKDSASDTYLSTPGGDIVPTEMQLERLRSTLADLLLKYTDEHPDVKRIRGEIVNLERKLKEEVEVVNETERRYVVTPMNRSLVEQLKQANLDIKSMRAERANLIRQIDVYQRRVEMAPRVEAELSILTRDYEKTEEDYQELLQKRQEAQRSANLESRQKGQQFKILDPAPLPQAPYKPNRPRIVMLGIILGLGLGFGAIFLAEHFDHSFRTVADVEDFCNIAVLTAVPRFTLRKPGQAQRIRRIAAWAAVLALVAVAAMFAILFFGFHVTPLDLIKG